jgi:TfoX/Sxy family transcriptional regulator of competence genes
MAYNEILAGRMRGILAAYSDIVEKKMFGGTAFLLRGNMVCGVHKQDLIVRVGLEKYKEALKKPHTRPFDMTGKAMAGWIVVESGAWGRDEDLNAWIKLGVDFAQSLPPK